MDPASANSPASSPATGNPWAAVRVLRDFFQARLDAGQKRIWLSRDARQALRQIVMSRPGRPASPPRDAKISTTAKPAPKEACIAPNSLTLDERTARLAAVREQAEIGTAPRALGTLRDVMVFAVGSPMAQIMFVGEAPGYDEEKQREPFVGKAGQLLTKIIQAMGLAREDVYISNICKFRPKIEGQTTDNRKPTLEEMLSCLPFIREEIEIIAPKAIVALGATAAEGLLGLTDPVSRLRGKFHDYRGIPVVVTYHPSYLLRNQALSERRKVWEDMLLVMERLGMEITEKQRRFFSSSA